MSSIHKTDNSFFIQGIPRLNWLFFLLYSVVPVLGLNLLEWSQSGRIGFYSRGSEGISFLPVFGVGLLVLVLNYCFSRWASSLQSFSKIRYASTISFFYLNFLLFIVTFYVPQLSISFLLSAVFCGALNFVVSPLSKSAMVFPGMLVCGFLFLADFKMLVLFMMFSLIIYSYSSTVSTFRLAALAGLAVFAFLFLKNDAMGLYSNGLTTNDFIHSGLNCLDAKALDSDKQLQFFLNEVLYSLNPLISALGLSDYRFSHQVLELLKARHGVESFETAAYNFGIFAQFCYFDVKYWLGIILLTFSAVYVSFRCITLFNLDRRLMLGIYIVGILNLFRSGFGMFISFIAIVLVCQIIGRYLYILMPLKRRS